MYNSNDELWEKLYGVEEIKYPVNSTKILLIIGFCIIVGVLVYIYV